MFSNVLKDLNRATNTCDVDYVDPTSGLCQISTEVDSPALSVYEKMLKLLYDVLNT